MQQSFILQRIYVIIASKVSFFSTLTMFHHKDLEGITFLITFARPIKNTPRRAYYNKSKITTIEIPQPNITQPLLKQACVQTISQNGRFRISRNSSKNNQTIIS